MTNIDRDDKLALKLTKIYMDFASAMQTMRYLINVDLSKMIGEIDLKLKDMRNSLDSFNKLIDCNVSISKIYLFDCERQKCEVDIDVSMYKIQYLMKSTIVESITAYDSFFKGLLTFIISQKPEMMKIIDTKLVFDDFRFCDNHEDVRKLFVDKFFDAHMRKSHKDQIKWLQEKQGLDINKKNDIYNNFILTSEIRNLYVHNDGQKNSIFENNMLACNIKKESYDKYFENGVNKKNILELITNTEKWALCLFIDLTNKYFHKNSWYEDIFGYINGYAVDMIDNYPEIAEFYFDLILDKMYLPDNEKFIVSINKCIVLKRKKEKFSHVLTVLDWSNCSNIYYLAKHVLLEEFDDAVKIMSKIDDKYDYTIYYMWPLFNEFVKTESFKEEFRNLYGEEYNENGLSEYVDSIVLHAENVMSKPENSSEDNLIDNVEDIENVGAEVENNDNPVETVA